MAAVQQTGIVRTSCHLCRKRHKKCDGQVPCAFCVKIGTACVYETPKRPGRKPRDKLDEGAIVPGSHSSTPPQSFITTNSQMAANWTSTYLQLLQELGYPDIRVYFTESFSKLGKEWVCGAIPIPSQDILWHPKPIGEQTIFDQEQLLLMYTALTTGAALAQVTRSVQQGIVEVSNKHLDEFSNLSENLWKNIRDQPTVSPVRIMALILWTVALHVGGKNTQVAALYAATRRSVMELVQNDPQLPVRSSLIRWIFARAYVGSMKCAVDTEERQLWFNKSKVYDEEFPLLRIMRLSHFTMCEVISGRHKDPEIKAYLLSLLDESQQVIEETFNSMPPPTAHFETANLAAWKNYQFLAFAARARILYDDGELPTAFQYNQAIIENLRNRLKLPSTSVVFVALCLLHKLNEIQSAVMPEVVTHYVELFDRYSAHYCSPPHVLETILRIRAKLQTKPCNGTAQGSVATCCEDSESTPSSVSPAPSSCSSVSPPPSSFSSASPAPSSCSSNTLSTPFTDSTPSDFSGNDLLEYATTPAAEAKEEEEEEEESESPLPTFDAMNCLIVDANFNPSVFDTSTNDEVTLDNLLAGIMSAGPVVNWSAEISSSDPFDFSSTNVFAIDEIQPCSTLIVSDSDNLSL